jgi:hypothetical protein
MATKKAAGLTPTTPASAFADMIVLSAADSDGAPRLDVAGRPFPAERVLAIPPEVARLAMGNRDGFRRVLTAYADAAQRARATGDRATLALAVSPDGSVQPTADQSEAPTAAAEADTSDEQMQPAVALDRARRKGADTVASVLTGPDMLSSDEMAARIGASRETVNQKRHRGELLGVGGAKRGIRYPCWQLDASGARTVPGLSRLIAACRGDHWRAYRVLCQPHPEMGGVTGLDALTAGRIDDLEAVVAGMEQGAFA